jgi:hypothetical protein|tara:strand:- start:2885 stop:3214 length:330 start_codon:yes stop_codon:yes gene_type:complete
MGNDLSGFTPKISSQPHHRVHRVVLPPHARVEAEVIDVVDKEGNIISIKAARFNPEIHELAPKSAPKVEEDPEVPDAPKDAAEEPVEASEKPVKKKMGRPVGSRNKVKK